MTDPQAVGVLEIAHTWAVQRRVRRLWHPIEPFTPDPVERHVCACGWATRWWHDPARAMTERSDHACEGQLPLWQ